MSFLYFFNSYTQSMFLAGASIVTIICGFFILPVAYVIIFKCVC
ncbi:MAG: hypothetical protein ACMG6E_04885 [Candidatus Roizmanbacteria bacterium]